MVYPNSHSSFYRLYKNTLLLSFFYNTIVLIVLIVPIVPIVLIVLSCLQHKKTKTPPPVSAAPQLKAENSKNYE